MGGGGGKAGGAGQTYDYYGTLAGGLCVGPVDELVAIIANGQEVWPKGTPWKVGLAITAGTIYVFDAQSWTCTANHTATTANAPGSGLNGWSEYTFVRAVSPYDDFSLTQSDGTHLGTLRFYWGTNAQTVGVQPNPTATYSASPLQAFTQAVGGSSALGLKKGGHVKKKASRGALNELAKAA